MKLLNYTLGYLSAALFLILSIWAAVFYFEMLDEVYDSIDDGLENYKTIIIQKAASDSTILNKNSFGESNYYVEQISGSEAVVWKDVYKDTLMFMQNEHDFEPVRMLTSVFEIKGRFYQLRVISSMVEEDDLIEDLLYSLLWLYLALIASILLVNNLVLKRVWQPFYSLLEQLKNFRLGKKERFVPEQTRVKEFDALNKAVESFVNSSTDVYERQKQFIENAAHELQTPLAISLNKLELLMERPDLDEESLQISSNIIDSLQRMVRFNRSLLLLSKIENRQFGKNEETDLDKIVQRQAEDFKDMAEFKNIRIILHREGPCKVKMDEDLANILLQNLLKNALVHNIAGGQLHVRTGTGFITVSNTGQEKTLDAKRLFQRFYKESSEKSTSGLGLAISKAIAAVYGFSIHYAHDTMHHFTVKF